MTVKPELQTLMHAIKKQYPQVYDMTLKLVGLPLKRTEPGKV